MDGKGWRNKTNESSNLFITSATSGAIFARGASREAAKIAARAEEITGVPIEIIVAASPYVRLPRRYCG